MATTKTAVEGLRCTREDNRPWKREEQGKELPASSDPLTLAAPRRAELRLLQLHTVHLGEPGNANCGRRLSSALIIVETKLLRKTRMSMSMPIANADIFHQIVDVF